ncbi:hypothetical protein BDP27DRAFT_1381526 [Rhodocollybia butyracea]|uniref:G-patch domain-containing protein n=1 Tax=Rhodocollybia butyracea TaxID=206335 RepID=A0A9P5UC43_9AGAR|nr:hypothetical protein BDP27DRAFT_1381526 [Rhodocollybia butyracea]
MSAITIARWNAISENSESPSSLKRKHDDDDDDDISIVSRSPSPAPEAMDVDGESIHKFDEYIRKPAAPEVITVDTRIKSTNKGFAMLAKLGWVEGQPLGLSGQGRVDPIPFQMKADSTGLGKVRQDVEMIETTVSQRRELDSERQVKETEEQRRAREIPIQTLHTEEISDTLKAFYCTLCDKQFKNVAQYDEHTNSYAHHHKARFRDMQANARIKPQEEIDKRKEKERKREEKELRKIAAASGIKMAKSTLPTSVLAPVVPEAPSGSKPSGWAPVSTSVGVLPSSDGFKKAGWASVAAPLPAPDDQADSTPSSGWKATGSSGGWSLLDTSLPVLSPPLPRTDTSPTEHDVPPPPPPSAPASTTMDTIHQPPPQPSKSHISRVGWQQFQKKNSKR